MNVSDVEQDVALQWYGSTGVWLLIQPQILHFRSSSVRSKRRSETYVVYLRSIILKGRYWWTEIYILKIRLLSDSYHARYYAVNWILFCTSIPAEDNIPLEVKQGIEMKNRTTCGLKDQLSSQNVLYTRRL
jgi:hypothetical protein